ncbi:F-box protein At5g07610-like [Papaver somniferum]|uniref:F-box protein At5g07610-like n=1 Tax=Papaver somniferum TaxID=3469 RepID=UPI000E6FB29E|nr:F-box protein At5g07610-like [Papaver somniferum]
MCCSSIRASFLERTYYVFNPFAKQFRSIVSGSQGKEKGFVVFSSVSLAYDPRNSPHYKVVCIWFTKQPEDSDTNVDLQLEIYSSETATWKLSGDVFSAPRRSFLYKSGVFWKGSLHWIDPSIEGNSFCFNVDQELRMKMPDYRSVPSVEDKMMVKFFGECRGHLHLIVSPASLSSFEVLEMETDYMGWNVKYHVSPQELIILYPRPPAFDVLLVEEVECNSSKVVLLIQDKVFSYDIQDKSFKEIHRLAPGLGVFPILCFYLVRIREGLKLQGRTCGSQRPSCERLKYLLNSDGSKSEFGEVAGVSGRGQHSSDFVDRTEAGFFR